MATYITVTDGPMKGQQFELKGGERFGRDKGEIVLNDPKVSSQHALVKKSLMGHLTLTDQRSKNGIIVEGKRVDRVKLKDGVEFRIGANLFRVEVVAKGTATNAKSLASDASDSSLDESVSPDPPLEKPPEEDIPLAPPEPELEVQVEPDLKAEEGEPEAIYESPDSFSADHPEITDATIDPESIKDGNTFVYEPESDDEDDEPTVAGADKKITAEIIDDEEEDTAGGIVSEEELLDLEKENLSSLSLKDLTKAQPAGPESKLSFRTLEPKTDEEKKGLFEQPEKKTWSRVLEKFSRKNLKSAMDQLQSIEPLNPRVKLTFFRGTQAETEWELGYGPRTAGATSMDLPIWEPGAPSGDCFVISPGEKGPLFSTKFPYIVKINGKSVEEVTLKSGDIISIVDTEIEVELF